DSFEELIATEKLMQTGHRSLLVMEGGRLAGVLSIVDLMAGLRPGYLSAPRPSTADQIEYSAMFWTGLFTTQAKVLAGKKVREVMSDPPPAVNEEANLMEIANLLYETESRRLAVYSGDRVAGVVREQEVFFELARLILNV
ncbi:MAG: CBS domain-containing protein, partial [Proteobacteria bacterium]|nr:CBS domain-containing protein [Pseudomonadota bacterium]